MLYRTLKRMIEKKFIEGLEEKIDFFYATNKLTKDEYESLINMLK